jgi:hypothetical protein
MKSTPIAPSGCETSSEMGLSRQAKSINATLGKSMLATLTASHNAISSQGSEDGATPCASRCTQTIDLFGQDHVPASPSPLPEKAKHQAMNATSGPNGSDLSEQFDRQSSLANRLKRQLDGVGSTLFNLTWKKKATPLGRPYYQLAASGRRTSDNDCGSWQTPKVATGKYQYINGDKTKPFLNLEGQVELASWPTPRTTDGHGNKEHGQGGQALHTVSGMTSSGSPAQTESKGQLAPWPTPCVVEPLTHPDKVWERKQRLTAKTGIYRGNDCGLGSKVQTTGKGQLNPSFSLWLMGYPAEWLSCAPQATRLSRKSRQSSSKRA